MSLFLDKLAAALLLPPGSLLVGFVLAAALAGLGRSRAAAAVALLTCALLWLLATPLVSHLLTMSLQEDYPAEPAAALPVRDAIVVLGGGLGAAPDPDGVPDMRAGADRLWHAARLWHAGRAPVIVVSGGNVWPDGRPTEAEGSLRLLMDLGVSRDAILLEDASRNTWQNAQRTRSLLEAKQLDTVLLVTSADHMRRALWSFEAVGIDVHAAATDHSPSPSAPLLLQLLPDANALATSADALREHLGLLRYRLRPGGDRSSQT